MPGPLSPIGIGHTLISLVPLGAGAYSFVRYHHIDPGTRAGKTYLAGLTLVVITAFGLSSTGGINAGHVLGVLALLAAWGGALLPRTRLPARLQAYACPVLLSFSFFLLGVPGIGETLRRLPPAHPLADTLQSPILLGTLGTWLALFVLGTALQGWWIWSRRKQRA
ncbi:hypothetical protein RAN3_3098 [plant metagenome]|uniref:DUF2306 domain-containing protein n=1 Tax=plant metagenome TaxID=1297885 RepID=A0A484U6I7_9ZZZZ